MIEGNDAVPFFYYTMQTDNSIHTIEEMVKTLAGKRSYAFFSGDQGKANQQY